MLQNWLWHVRRHASLEPMVFALDRELLKVCQQQGLPCVLQDPAAFKADMQRQGKKFTHVGVSKLHSLKAVQSLVEAGHDLIFSDVDVAWLKDPGPYLASEPAADVFISVDCLSPSYDAGRQPKLRHWGNHHSAHLWQGWWPRCGHLEGDGYGVAFNAGILVFRANPRTVAFLQMLVDDMYKMSAAADGHTEAMLHDMTDQESFIKLLTAGAMPIRILPGSRRAFKAANGVVNAATLPVAEFANGHVYFVQRIHQATGVSPIAVHATYNPGGNPGKVMRFREELLWRVDPDAYFAGGSYITYDDVLPPELVALRDRSETQLEAHLKLMAYYKHVLVHLVALSRILNRTIIMPRFMCLCDRDEHPDNLPECKFGGSDLELPFRCPMDYVVNTMKWDKQIEFKESTFLDHPRIAPDVAGSVHTVLFANHERWRIPERHDDATWTWRLAKGPPAGGGHLRTTRIRAEAIDARAVERLQGLRGHRVLKLSGIGPSFPFCAWALDPDRAQLKALLQELVLENTWCCSAYDKSVGTHAVPYPWAGVVEPKACPR